MTALPSLAQADVEQLQFWFPGLKFDTPEQLHALLHMDSADFQAAPGSGKTTLLGAKLALLSSKWLHRDRGICVLSHTNVAREEIEQRVRSVPGGDALLVHPHYVGTIQTFVNRHISLPWLRSQQVELRDCDDDAVAERLLERARKNFAIAGWLKHNAWEGENVIRGIRFRGADMSLVTKSEKGELPAKGRCITELTRIKRELAADGWLCYDDMFAYALQALRDVPGLASAVAHRFPLVFIDEMQDTSDVQLDVLTEVFCGRCVVQRFGDVNQTILNRSPGTHSDAFPRKGYAEVSSSLRFGSAIADAANSIKIVGGPIQGAGEAAVMPPALALYSDTTITEVPQRFGSLAASLLSQEDLRRFPIKALCAVKRPGNLKQRLGRHLPDYFPAYRQDDERVLSPRSGLCELVHAASQEHGDASGYLRRVAAARTAIVRVLQSVGTLRFEPRATWTTLVSTLSAHPLRLQQIAEVALQLVRGQYDASDVVEWKARVRELVAAMDPLVDGAVDPATIPDFGFQPSTPMLTPKANSLPVVSAGREFDLQFSTIAGAKGETHLATLVLESCHRMRYDVSDVLPHFAGLASNSPPDAARAAQFRNLFVAVTRPKRLLVLAAHESRVDAAVRNGLQNAGWHLMDWTT